MNDGFSEFKERLLAQLPVQQREAFEMYGNGMDYDIIAMRLGISDQWRGRVSAARN